MDFKTHNINALLDKKANKMQLRMLYSKPVNGEQMHTESILSIMFS